MKMDPPRSRVRLHQQDGTTGLSQPVGQDASGRPCPNHDQIEVNVFHWQRLRSGIVGPRMYPQPSGQGPCQPYDRRYGS
jgi:hypothetical protein